MRKRKKTVKLGRTASHRKSLLANLAISLIVHERITTTVAKAKALRPVVEKLLTLAKENTKSNRTLAFSRLHNNKDAVMKLFNEIAPRSLTRKGGYTRIIKVGFRRGDGAPTAFIEWVDRPVVADEEIAPATEEATPVTAEVVSEEASAEKKKPARKPRAKKADATEEPKAE